MLNVRQAFVEDSTFRWDQPLLDKARWTYGLVFSSGQDQAVVLFDPAGEVVGNSATGGQIAMEPEASRELEAFFREQFADRMP